MNREWSELNKCMQEKLRKEQTYKEEIIEQVKNVFLTVFLFAHGYASFIVNNALVCDEEKVKAQLETAYRGAILAEKEKSEWKS